MLTQGVLIVSQIDKRLYDYYSQWFVFFKITPKNKYYEIYQDHCLVMSVCLLVLTTYVNVLSSYILMMCSIFR